jgi:hypothetical protein
MPAYSDYLRGLEAARADARQGWTHCWMQARQLAEEAVYCRCGLSEEQQGYADGLDECFPGGLGEISGFLDQILNECMVPALESRHSCAYLRT